MCTHTCLATLMKALKCKPSAQLFAYKYTINVLSKCSNIISHRSSVFEGRRNDHRSSKVGTSIIHLRRSILEGRHIDPSSSIFESRYIDLRRPTTQHRTDIPIIRYRRCTLVASEASVMYELAVAILWYIYIYIFVSYDLFGPAWAPVTRNAQTSDRPVYVQWSM